MIDRLKNIVTCMILFGVFFCISTTWALADGTETLGAPSIEIASGTGIVAAGTGLIEQPGTITINVPGKKVKQVLLYWEGQQNTNTGDNTIKVNNISIIGSLIGGPTEIPFWTNVFNYTSTYRADITEKNLIHTGSNTLKISDLNFDYANNGAGILVIYDDGITTSNIQLRDGNDFAYGTFDPSVSHAPELETTVEQEFTFISATYARTASLTMFFSSVNGTVSSGGFFRPTAINITVGGATTSIIDQLHSNNGEEWDTLKLDVPISAGANSLKVQALSIDLPGGKTGRPASFAWNAAALSLIPPPCGTGASGCCKNHHEACCSHDR